MSFLTTKILEPAAETCISRPYINFWLRQNAVRNCEGTVTTA